MTNSNDKQKISGDEAQIYDRQIRLWGLEAQNRLRNSSVLIIGLSGLGAEVAKNLMLSGLKSLTLMDDKEVSDADFFSQFLIPSNAKGTNRAEASLQSTKVLNPMVEVNINAEQISAMPESFFQRFDLVILIDQDYNTTNAVNKICRKHKIRFQAGGIFGWIGFAYFDFNNHTFLIPKPKESQATIESVLEDDSEEEGTSAKKARKNDLHPPTVLTLDEEGDAKIKKDIPFPSFEQSFDVKLSIKKLFRLRRNINPIPNSYYVIRAFLRLQKEKEVTNITKEDAIEQWKKELEEAGIDESKQKFKPEDFTLFSKPALNPVCAIVGSMLSQEAIKALSQNDAPLKNIFLYSAVDSVGAICEISA